MIKRFDSRVVDRILANSIRPTPTLLYPDQRNDGGHQAYTLTTPKHQEAFTMARPNYGDVGVDSPPDAKDRLSHPDIWPCAPYKSPFYKTEGRTCYMFLPHVRPSVFWLYGGESYSADSSERKLKMQRTGSSWNGSGGEALGRVKEDVIPGAGHFVCFEKVRECAVSVSRFIDAEMRFWRDGEVRSVDAKWVESDGVDRQKMDERWLAEVKQWKGQRSVASKL